MRMLWIFSLYFAFSVQVVSAVELRWNPDTVRGIHYRTVLELPITDDVAVLDFNLLTNDPDLLAHEIDKIREMPINIEQLHVRATLTPNINNDVLRVEMVGIPMAFEGEPKNAEEQEFRHRVGAFAGTIQMHIDMDLSGNSHELSFYRSQRERNATTMLLYLPQKKVEVGDRWSIPVQLLTLGSGLIANNASQHNQAWLKNIKQTQLGSIAEVEFLLVEHAEGYAERISGDVEDRLPFSISFAYVGFGEFNIEKGYWQRIIGHFSALGTGSANIRKKLLYALVLED